MSKEEIFSEGRLSSKGRKTHTHQDVNSELPFLSSIQQRFSLQPQRGLRNSSREKTYKMNNYFQSMTKNCFNNNEENFNINELLKENCELRVQRDQYLIQLNKNEEMLWRAREIISKLRSDANYEDLMSTSFTEAKVDKVKSSPSFQESGDFKINTSKKEDLLSK